MKTNAGIRPGDDGDFIAQIARASDFDSSSHFLLSSIRTMRCGSITKAVLNCCGGGGRALALALAL